MGLPNSPSKVEAAYCCNRPSATAYIMPPGVYGLSNQLLNSPEKKLVQGKSKFEEIVSGLQDGSVDERQCEKQLLDLLCDETCLYPDENYAALGFPDNVLKHITSVFVAPTLLYGEPFGTR
ncbi:hypothetical protein GBAR_LOCUS8919 [Geodia barretti]|nr:hypothetical protein GBAR_LOCUS8919 [Geodia barretti]